MAVAKKCDRCGKFYEATSERVFKTEDGVPINSIRIGDWDQKSRSWNSIGSAYDLCDECGKIIYEAVCGSGSSIKIHAVERAKKAEQYRLGKNGRYKELLNDLEASQNAFADEEIAKGVNEIAVETAERFNNGRHQG